MTRVWFCVSGTTRTTRSIETTSTSTVRAPRPTAASTSHRPRRWPGDTLTPLPLHLPSALWGQDRLSRGSWGGGTLGALGLPGCFSLKPLRETGSRGLGKAWALTVVPRLVQPGPGCGHVPPLVLDLAENMQLVGASPECGRQGLRERRSPEWGLCSWPQPDLFGLTLQVGPRGLRDESLSCRHNLRAWCVLRQVPRPMAGWSQGLGSGGLLAAPRRTQGDPCFLPGAPG